MASTYSKLKIELIGTGDQAGQWGTTTNNNLGSSSAGVYRGLEQAIVGMATISSGFVANSYTLPYTNSNDDQEFRCLVLNITASLSNPSDLIVPAIQKPYIVINSSGQTVTVKVSGQTGVAVPNGAKILLYNTGTDVGTAVTYLTELKLGGNLTMPSAGSINDSNGNELIKFPSAVASAVNELTISNAATGSAPTLSATGNDTNIGITLTPKGTGTITLTANPTLSAGTANGVLYLDGSKVATSGSALTFDGSKLGIGASPVTPLFVKATSGGTDPAVITGERVRIQSNDTTGRSTYLSLIAGTGAYSGVLFGDQDAADVGLIRYLHIDNSMIFNISASEAMRLTATSLYTASGINVGIGTSSPATLLDLRTSNGVSAILRLGSSGTVGNTTVGTIEFYDADADDAGIKSSISNVITGNVGPGGAQGGNLLFSTATSGATPTERMRLDSSGNLGIGVTPSASASTDCKQIALGGLTYISSTNGTSGKQNFSTGLYYNAYQTSTASFNAIVSNSSGDYLPAAYVQVQGQHRWLTTSSATAGNAITFTQALTLDANRNLLLNGTTAGTSSVGTFAIFNGTAPTGSVTNGCILYAEDVSSSSELKVRDEAGNVTTLSPHNFSLIPEGPSEHMAWSYYSERDGRRINIDMLKAIRLLEKLSGEQLVYES